MSATVNKLVYGDLTFTDDEIQSNFPRRNPKGGRHERHG
nr:MAG TPA: hypothetical protein [Caudoviricetes sp.]